MDAAAATGPDGRIYLIGGLRDAPIRSVEEGPIRLLVAVKLGTTRLIDNIGV